MAPRQAALLLSLPSALLQQGVAQDVFLANTVRAESAVDAESISGPLLGGPPARALDYCGVALPPLSYEGKDKVYAIAIGDWGGLDGTLWENQWPPNGRARLITYVGGATPGPKVFPRSRWNMAHSEEKCNHKQFVECFDTHGNPPCTEGCGYVDDVDSKPQLLVAEQVKAYAAVHKPKFVLNVGDNFYWGGIERDCGMPMNQISPEAQHQFTNIFENVYRGPGLDGVPWLSVLGNHDWGGRVFNNGWDQQIAYTWASPRWLMPAPYFSQRINFPDQGFSMDVLFIDSNAMDARDPPEDSEHNLCSDKYNLGQGNDRRDATCASADGPVDVWTCKDWFWNFWRKNQEWAEGRLKESTADWQLVVTHFPCGHEAEWYRKLYGLGLDLLVTGHRHDQELWAPGYARFPELGGLYCIVTGGGGGITSEATPVKNDGNWYGEAQYGFYGLAISKTEIEISSIDYTGAVVKSATLTPHTV